MILSYIITAIVFIFLFSLLILVHEWGHFYFARRAGIKVEEFGIGLPPRAKKIYTDKKGTIYSLNWIPFGGYVRLYGEDSSDPKILKAKDSFASKSILQRISVIVAGVVMNFVLAWFLLTIGFMVGMKPILINQADFNKAIEAGYIEERKVLHVNEILEDSPLIETGLQTGDLIVEINDKAVPRASELSDILQPGEPIKLKILHDNNEDILMATPNSEGKLGFLIETRTYVIHVRDQKYSPLEAPVQAAGEVGRLSYATLGMLKDVVVTISQKFAPPDNVAGPVGIAQMTHQFTQDGIMALLQFAALLSISLGVINIMPFPALDGGRFLFIIFEIILRKKPNAKWEGIIHAVGFMVLILLILLITWHDILRFFR